MKSKVLKRMLAVVTMGSVLIGSSLCVSAEGLSDVFDADYYAEQNPDVVAIFGTDPTVLYNHFATYGVNEGRQGMASFNVTQYRNAYADLQATLGDNWDAYVEHYFTSGVSEGRTIGVYGTVTRMGDAVTVPETSTDSTTQAVPVTVHMLPHWDEPMNDRATVYEQVYSKIAALDINDDAAIKELDSYVRANINAIVGSEWDWMDSAYFNNGESLIIENQEVVSEDALMLGLEVANGREVYKGIRCYIGYSEVFSSSIEKNSIRTRNIYANGLISEDVR
ncbi:hypothetical protein FMM75_19705 [Lachnospiraceae bacterium MD335]|nr:hypothetical protein [Lachnospiraceae bacterium MD335]